MPTLILTIALLAALAAAAILFIRARQLAQAARAATAKIERMRGQIRALEGKEPRKESIPAPAAAVSNSERDAAREAKAQAKAERARRTTFFQDAAELAPMVAVDGEGGTYVVGTADDGVGRSLFVEGRRGEMSTLAATMGLLDELGIGAAARAGTFFDIGANIGTTTVPAMTEHRFARALACEPDPNNFRMLRMNVLVNGLDDRVDARQVALSDTEGVIGLALSQTNWGDHRVVVPGGTALAERETIEVERVPVDRLLERHGAAASDIGLVWIDAQGHEAEILAGAESVLAAGVPIVFELWMKTLDANGSVDRLHEIVEATSSLVYDLRTAEEGGAPDARPSGAIRELTDSYRESGKITDILLARPRS